MTDHDKMQLMMDACQSTVNHVKAVNFGRRGGTGAAKKEFRKWYKLATALLGRHPTPEELTLIVQ